MYAPRSSTMTMENTLRCNHLKCRKSLNDHAVVTTCSHVFCIECSDRCQLSNRHNGQRPVCPACSMQLPNPDDVVVTNLNPTEDYKTSVLSGLTPNVIIECAGRALSFWAYQTTQEIVYQEYLAKNLADKYASLNTQMDKIVHDANAEISSLRNRMSNMQLDQENLKRKNEELIQTVREKSRKQLQTQELYDKLKQRAMLGQVQNAAFEAIDTLQTSVTASQAIDRSDDHVRRPSQPSAFPSIQDTGTHLRHLSPNNPMFMGHAIGRGGTGDWAGFPSSQKRPAPNQPVQTASTHRHQLSSTFDPIPHGRLLDRQPSTLSATAGPGRNPSSRSPLANPNSNIPPVPGFSGYGMSAGLKVSNPQTSTINGFADPVLASRVAQRPVSRFSPSSNSSYRPSLRGNMFSNRSGFF